MNRPKFYIYLPIVFALVLILGIFIGNTFNLSNREGVIPSGGNRYNKLGTLLRYVQQEYVDTINEKKLVDETIVQVLQNLDPHSSYITAEELQATNEPLTGHFGGVGIEFNTVNDTVCVVAVIAGGPAESVGLKAGDKIITVDDKTIAGIKITNQKVMEALKGESGTKVKVKIKRKNKPELLDFTITRGKIPIYSIDVANMVSEKTGYIKISRFAATTYDEFITAFKKLKEQGMEKLIVDLRENSGGFLNTAVDLANEFLEQGKEIVYTQGKARPRKDYIASTKGSFITGDLVILIDEGSASASEILAGAIQDNDRGTIIGRRSFGKGLVQEQSEFTDGSAIRLTIARYYTPTGRCIQKPYNNGIDEYYAEENNRFKNGELENADSIKVTDSLKYKTPKGKIVYGGGGIVPDVFVPMDVSGITHYINEISNAGLIIDFAFSYADKERVELRKHKTVQQFNEHFEVKSALFKEFIDYCTKNKIPKNEREINKSEKLIKLQLKALIARDIWSNDGYYAVIEAQDNVLNKAIDYLKK